MSARRICTCYQRAASVPDECAGCGRFHCKAIWYTGRGSAAGPGLRIVGDANIFVHGSGVPTFYYGPSNETAHADVEWVSVERIAASAKVYALLAVDYCGRSD